MERILALHALTTNSINSNLNNPILNSDRSVGCSSETTQGCSTESNHCTGADMPQW